jgi:hypothetical protein
LAVEVEGFGIALLQQLRHHVIGDTSSAEASCERVPDLAESKVRCPSFPEGRRRQKIREFCLGLGKRLAPIRLLDLTLKCFVRSRSQRMSPILSAVFGFAM